MPTTDTPLRYPGGKTQLTPFVSDLMRTNELVQCVYCEPFAGGAGIAFRLLVTGMVSEVWINDIDRSIFAFWKSVLDHSDALCDLISNATVDMAEWRRQREIQSDTQADHLALGFSTLFLNRTNRSGILRGGVIGGKEQLGNYPIDCRFGKEDLVRKIQRIALYKEQVRLTAVDAKRYITTSLKRLPKLALVNVDPPYYKKGPGLYTNFYKHEDHKVLAEAVRGMPHRWMLTYDDHPQITAMYAGLPQYRKQLTYYASVKRSAAELLVLSPRLVPPPSLVASQLNAA